MDKSRLIVALLFSAAMGALLWELIRISIFGKPKPKIGFAAMTKKQRRAIAAKGGRAAQAKRRERERLDY